MNRRILSLFLFSVLVFSMKLPESYALGDSSMTCSDQGYYCCDEHAGMSCHADAVDSSDCTECCSAACTAAAVCDTPSQYADHAGCTSANCHWCDPGDTCVSDSSECPSCDSNMGSCCSDANCYDYCDVLIWKTSGTCSSIGGPCTYTNTNCADEGNECTEDSCDDSTGCSYTNVADGTSCSGGECQSGACVEAAAGCGDGTCDSDESISSCPSDCCPADYSIAITDAVDCVDCGRYWCSDTSSCVSDSSACVVTEVTCTEPEVKCDGACVNTNTDANNCGACGNVCASDQECKDGVCTAPVVTQTCADMGGNFCASDESCDGEWKTASDGNNCCVGTCKVQEEIQTCADMGGNFCASDESCDGEWKTASDGDNCCVGTCVGKEEEGCEARGGVCCSHDQRCEGGWMAWEQDCEMCCYDGTCVSMAEDLAAYAATLTLTSGEKDSAGKIVGWVQDCLNAYNNYASSDPYKTQYECLKACEWNMRNEASKYQDLSEEEWQEFASYIMINSPGETPNMWMNEWGETVVEYQWKQLVKEKLNLNFNQCPENEDVCVDCWINWEKISLSTDQKKRVSQARDDFWKWKDQQKAELLKGEMGAPTGDAATIGQEIIDDYLTELKTLAETFADNPNSGDAAYNMAYKLRITQGYLEGVNEQYRDDFDLMKDIGDYVALKGPGTPDIWEDEFGEAKLGDLRIFEKVDGKKRFELRFNHGCDEYEGRCWLNVWFNQPKASGSVKEQWRKGENDAEEKAKEAKMAGLLEELKESFTITDENKKIAEQIKESINSFVDKAKTFASSMTGENAYAVAYASELIRAEMDGYREGLEFEQLWEIRPYLLIYTTGTPNVWYDESEGIRLDDCKEFYKDDNIRVAICTGCDDYEEQCWIDMQINIDKKIEEKFKNQIKKAQEAARHEAERLRRALLIAKAREQFEDEFTADVAAVGDEIIERLEGFRSKVIDFEESPNPDAAYQLQYDFILLRSEFEGYRDAWRDQAESIGKYVILYGPGMPDIWKQWEEEEIELGHHLMVYEGEATIKPAATTTGTTGKGMIQRGTSLHFNWWYDESREEGGFDLWLDWGRFAKTYKDNIKQAEREAWREADMLRKLRLAEKLKLDLEELGVIAGAQISAVESFITTAQAYAPGGATTAYDVELARLQANEFMEELDWETMQYIVVATPGYPEIWYDWDRDELNLGGWKENVTSTDYFVANMGNWCHPEEEWCRAELMIDWEDWRDIDDELRRANDNFWRQKREKEIADKLAEIVELKSEYSSADQVIESEVVEMIAEMKSLAESYVEGDLSTTEFQYQVLVKRDGINEKLDEAADESIVKIAIAEAEGYHDYDEWNEVVRAVEVYTGTNFDVRVGYHPEFTPTFFEKEVEEFETFFKVEVEVVWKVWDSTIQDQIESAYKRYEAEQGKKRLESLVAKRDEIVLGLEDRLRDLAKEYESGSIGAGELRNRINGLFFRLESYDNEVAYLSAVIGQPFPAWTPLDIAVSTENVRVSIFEEEFEYKFGRGIGLEQIGARGMEFAPEEFEMREEFGVETERTFQQRSDDVEIDQFGNVMAVETPVPEEEGEEGPTGRVVKSRVTEERMEGEEIEESETVIIQEAGPGGININVENVEGDVTIIVIDKDVAMEIEQGKMEMYEEKTRKIKEMRGREREVFIGDKNQITMRKNIGATTGDRLTIEGLRPRLKLGIDLTEAEIGRLADEIKAKWQEAKQSGMIEDAIYNINMAIDDQPSMAEAIRKWGDVTTSFELHFKGTKVFAFHFRTEDGYIAGVDYDVAEGAGTSPDNVYIGADFETLIKFRYWWEERLKNARGPGEIITALPVFIGKVAQMVLSGDIKIQPFGTIFKIGDFMQVMFSGVLEGSGVGI